MSKKLYYFLGIIVSVILVVFLIRLFSKEDSWIFKEKEWFKISKKEEKTELPNPASQNCINQGGRLEKLVETAGDLGICKFTDGTECEEWKFFRGECQKGKEKKADISHPYYGLITKNPTGYLFKTENGIEYQLKLPQNYPPELSERLFTESKSKEKATIIAEETPPLSKILTLQGFLEK